MIRQKTVYIIIATISLILLLCINVPKFWTSEEKNTVSYEQGLEEYKSNEFQDAYYLFSKVSKSSKLKPAALYRQALCANKLSDETTATKKYKSLIRNYPNSKLAVRANYLYAQSLYDSNHAKKAKKEFKGILKKYPNTDYAIASGYYLGSIEAENIQNIRNKRNKIRVANNAAHYFRAYLKEVPSGRFAINAIDKWVSVETSSKKKFTNEDNLIIAKAYQANENYKNAQKYLNFTNIKTSWPYLVKNAYALKDYSKVKYYTEQGLKGKGAETVSINEDTDESVENKNIYEAMDDYLNTSSAPKSAISYLLSFSQKADGYDYLLYKHCNNLPANSQLACFNTLYSKYPNGQFAAEALSNIFYAKIKSKDYFVAKQIGKRHLSEFRDSNSAPKVMFWLAKLATRMKNYEEARSYYKSLLSSYPDDYYAYHAFLNLNKTRHPVMDLTDLEGKEVLFPYKRTSENDLIIRLAGVKDYGLINELCKDNDFIQSWLEYQQGNYATSTRIARDAMEKLKPKPSRNDLRWRLVYPVHYYDEIKKNARPLHNSPILILSIIREESYFNPKSKSPVGASGLMQLMPSTAEEIAAKHSILVTDQLLLNPSINIKLGNLYYAQLRNALSNRDMLAVLAYNGGIGSVSSWKESLNYIDVDDFVEQIPYQETQNYLKKVYKSYWNYVRIYSGE